MPLRFKDNATHLARRILFAVLLIVSIVLVTLYSHETAEGPIHRAQDAVISVTGRVGSFGAVLGSGTHAISETAANATANEATLTALREQNEQLRRLLADTEEYRQEILRLRALLDMKQASGVTGKTAEVIGRSMSSWDQSITIDLGSEDGVESGMTVMGATGVIGQVSRVQPHTATVRLLSDPNSGAAVIVQSTRANAIVRGSIDGMLYLEDIEDDKIPEVGDVIITSGLGGSYSRGLIVGSVVSVGRTAGTAGGSIVVSPNDRADMLEEVIVVMDTFKGSATDPQIAAERTSSGEGASSGSAGGQ